MLGIGLGLTSMRGGQSPAGYLAARGLDWSNAGFDFSSGERWWLPSNSGDPTSAARWATRSEWAAQFTRAGSSYYVNALGNLTLAGTNELRIDYSSGSPRVLLEGASTNLTTYSGDTSNAVWTINGVTKTSGQADPLGGTGAAIFSGSGNSLKFASGGTGLTYTSGVAYTGSYFVKNSSSGFVQLTFPSSAFGTTQYADFSLTGGGSVTATGGTVVAQIFKLSNGWFRISLTAICTESFTTGALVIVCINTGTAARIANSTGDQSITAWGCNVTAQDFLSSYINSGASATSRVGDLFRAPVGAENVMIGRDTFGVLARCDGLRQSAGGSNTLAVSTIFGAADVSILRNASGAYPYSSFSNDTTAELTAAMPSGNLTSPFSVAFTQTTLNRRLSAKGSSVATSVLAVNPATRIDIGQRNGGSSPDYRGYKTVAFGPTLLSDAQLLALSGAV